ncbi:retropepsin-like domain-containing protein [Candidatus Curtissbacteria bacterium]|nr:retropepsin-like domain-containing protein [Candidatus Curtissbacteria bacterium]
MIFHYQEISPQIIRPIVPIVLKARNKFAVNLALIDSGADRCIFDIEIAKALSIKLRPNKISLKGIGRDKVVGNLGEIELNINGISYDLIAIFAPMEEFDHGILGQKGFFDHFDIRLNYRNKIIEIKKLPEVN